MKTFKSFFTGTRLLRSAAAATVLAVLLAGLASCSNGAAKGTENEKLSLVLTTQTIGQPLIVLAREKGYFEEEGLDIEYVNLTSGTIEAVSIGKVEILPSGIIPSLTYASQHAGLTVYAGTASGGNFLIAQPDRVEELKDIVNWKDKKLGTVRLSTSELVSRRALEGKGIDVEKDVKYVEIDSYTNIVEAVRKGAVDIGFVSAEYGKIARDLGLGILFPMTDLAPNYVCCRQTAYKKSVDAKRGAYVKLLQAQLRAYKDFIGDQEGTIKILAKYSTQSEDYVYRFLYSPEDTGNRTFSPDPAINKIREVYQTLEKWGYVEPGVKVEDFVDITIYQDALDNIAKRYPDEQIYKELQKEFKTNNL